MKHIVAIEDHTHDPVADRITLDFDGRKRRRLVLTTEAGERVLLDMPRAVHLRAGNALMLDDGRRILVHAADEDLIEIAADDAAHLVRIAWHLGNRHLPTQLLAGEGGGRIRIRYDHVIEEMVVGLGGRCGRVSAPFDPEGGAYAGGGAGHHHHHDDDEQDHGHHHG
jgi:urease accessory protein